MDVQGEVATPEPEEARPRRSPRRRRWVVAVALVVALLLVAPVGFLVRDARLDLRYEGPDGPVPPGAEVTVRDPSGGCGPLVVTLHRRSHLGPWDRTHSGNIRTPFSPDARPWWRPGGTTFTPVPCSADGTTTFTLPEDLEPGTIAACDSGGGCARIQIAG